MKMLYISKDEDLELHLKRKPYSCLINNYFDVDLKAWQVNMDMLYKYKSVTYMCQYFSKTKNRGSQATKEASL